MRISDWSSDVCSSDLQHVAIQAPLFMLRVGDVAERAAVEVDAVAGGTVGMVERRGDQPHAELGLQHVAGREVVEGDVGREDLRRHRKEGGVHELHQDVVQRQLGNQMARPQADAVALVEKRGEERQADDVVVMGVGEEDVSLEGAVRSEEHTSELQSLMRNSYAVFCLKK